jgi:hypothetical protein
MSTLKHQATFGLLLSAALVLSFVAVVQLAAQLMVLPTTNIAAYAQDNENNEDSDSTSPSVEIRADATVLEAPATFTFEAVTNFVPIDYFWDCGDGDVREGTELRTFSCTYNQPGTYTVTVHTVLPDVPPDEPGIISDTIEVTVIPPLPPLNERFDSQGQCIKEANTNPNAGFTKEDCKAAFKT